MINVFSSQKMEAKRILNFNRMQLRIEHRKPTKKTLLTGHRLLYTGYYKSENVSEFSFDDFLSSEISIFC